MAPYNSAKEPLPRKEINARSFHEAERFARNIPKDILAILEEHEYTDEDFEYIRDLARTAMSVNYPKGVRIGLRGDSGTGKPPVLPIWCMTC